MSDSVTSVDTGSQEADVLKQQIRCLIANVYDLQKLRISAGNRLVQSFYLQLGVAPSTSPDDVDKEEKKMIDRLKAEYKRITDAVAENNKSIKSNIKALRESDEEGKRLTLIRNDQDFKLVESYTYLLKAEEESTKSLDKYVKQHKLWDAFFADIKGCGTLMSAVCIAYLDPYVAKYPSSFFRYCGMDTVQDEDKDGNKLYLEKVEGVVTGVKVREAYGYYNSEGQYFGKVQMTDNLSDEGNILFKGEDGGLYEQRQLTKVVDGQEMLIYEEVESGKEYVGDVVVSQHGRKMGDTEMVEYVDAEGNRKLKRSITYNPFVKTKLMGVLTGCLIKAKDPVYSKIYYDYKARLDNSPRYEGYTPAHKNMMAQRYMIKQFLRNLHTEWRHLEGLPIYEPYEVEKLGNKPHHLNERQHKLAQDYKTNK
jgi:hypothetical protein